MAASCQHVQLVLEHLLSWSVLLRTYHALLSLPSPFLHCFPNPQAWVFLLSFFLALLEYSFCVYFLSVSLCVSVHKGCTTTTTTTTNAIVSLCSGSIELVCCVCLSLSFSLLSLSLSAVLTYYSLTHSLSWGEGGGGGCSIQAPRTQHNPAALTAAVRREWGVGSGEEENHQYRLTHSM